MRMFCSTVLSFICEFCKPLVVLGLSNHCQTSWKAPITGAFWMYLQFLSRFFPPPLLKGEALYSLVLFPCFCQRHRAGYNFSTRKEEVYSSLMQASPGHMLFIACLFTAIISCEPGQSHCCTQGALVSEHSAPWHAWAKLQPLPMPAQRSSPSPWALHIAFSCRWIRLVPEEEQSTLQVTAWSLRFRLLFIHNRLYRSSFAATKSGLGKKNARTFHLQVSWNNNLLKKDFEM